MIDNKETPVLLILFNRVSISNELLKSLREAKPKIIYIFFDGPRDQQKNSDQSSINLIEVLRSHPIPTHKVGGCQIL